MRAEVEGAPKATEDRELVFGTEQVQQNYWMAALCAVAGIILFTYAFGASRPGATETIAGLLSFLCVIGAWIGFWQAYRGYPRLALRRNNLTLHNWLGNSATLDLATLGTAHVVRLRRRRLLPPMLFLGFRGRKDDEALLAWGIDENPSIWDLKDIVPLDGLIGSSRRKADEIAFVVNEYRRQLPPLPPMSKAEIDERVAADRRAKRRRLIMFIVLIAAALTWFVIRRSLG